MEKKNFYTPSLVLMIIGIIFSLISPLVAYVCCIISIVMCAKNKAEFRVKPVIILDIVGLVIAVANNILAAMMFMNR